jgi:hypothetical protein
MSSSVQTRTAKPISDMRRSSKSMRIMKSNVAYAMNLCAKSIQALVSNLKVLGSIQQISNYQHLWIKG